MKIEESLETVTHTHTHTGLQPSRNKRIIWLDFARALAIILVVFCHATEAIYRMDMSEWNQITIQSKLFRTVAFTLGRLGVPFFLFISGKLLLAKTVNNTDDCIKFYKKNLIPLLITVEIWNVLYNIFIPIIKNADFSMKTLLLNVCFLEKVNLPNMWYMPMIIGIYVAIPFLAILVKKVDLKVLKIPMIVVFITSFVISDIGRITKILFNENYSTILNTAFLGGEYGLYILLGYYIGEDKFKKIKSKNLLILTIVSFILTCIYQIWLYNNNTAYNVWYNFTGILITSLCLFELFSRVKFDINEKITNCFTYISKISLGIFFLHIVVQEILVKIFEFNFVNRQLSIIILTISVLLITIGIIFVLSKIRFIKEKVFLIKN